MNEVKLFENPEFGTVRTVEIDGLVWFVGKDVANALGYVKPENAIAMHVEETDKGVTDLVTPRGTGGTQHVKIINESGLYALILASKLPGAKRFKRWITSEVLPSLRKVGYYTIDTGQGLPSRPITTEDYIEAAKILSKCQKSTIPLVVQLLKRAGLTIDASCLVMQKPMPKNEEVGITLKDLSERLSKYTLSELQKMLGLPKTACWGYRNGTRMPSDERLKQMWSVLDEEEGC